MTSWGRVANGWLAGRAAADEPDPRKNAFLARLATVEDLTRLVNIVAQAERAGRTSVAAVWSANQSLPARYCRRKSDWVNSEGPACRTLALIVCSSLALP
jgi:hypothetical protein